MKRLLSILVKDDRNEITKFVMLLNIDEVPKTFMEAKSSKDTSFWKKIINDEIDSIVSNQIWKLVDLPPRCQPIGCK